nr:helix-turn-helix domain-containing protein [Candidatus Sigynarchaeum springense]
MTEAATTPFTVPGATEYICDIDGTLVHYYYKDTSLLANRPLLDSLLAAAEPLPWIQGEPQVFDGSHKVTFVTGRGPDLGPMTERWIRDRLGCHTYTIHFTPYLTAEQYVRDKLARIENLVAESRAAKVVVIEDDQRITGPIEAKADPRVEVWFVDEHEALHKPAASRPITPLEAQLLCILKDSGPLTRPQIAKRVQVPRTTIFDALRKLIERGEATKFPFHPAGLRRRGRPQVLFSHLDDKK